MDPKRLQALQESVPQPLKDRERYVKAFIYGEFGVGKTILAASCTQNKGLIIATDTGTDSLYNHPELLEKHDIVPYKGLQHLTAVAEAISEGVEGYEQYDNVIVDTISQVQEEYLDWLLDNFKFSGNMRTLAEPRNARDRTLESQEITGLPDYHLARNKMRGPVKALIKAPVDVFFLAHLREPSMMDIQKGKLVRRPTLTETVFKLIAREASLLGLMERSAKERTVQFLTDKKTIAKSRIIELDNKTINADTLPQIIQEWKLK